MDLMFGTWEVKESL